MPATSVLISSLLSAPVSPSDPRLVKVLELEPEFDLACKRNMLHLYSEDIADYLVSPDGLCRAGLNAADFATRFAIDVVDAGIVVEYVEAFFAFFPK